MENLKIIAENSIEMVVKKEDTDIYEHLNNSHYPVYFEKARVSILKKIGFDDKELKKEGIGLFVTSSFYQYEKQTNSNQKIKIDSQLEINKAKIIVKSVMYNQTKERAKAETEHFFVNLKTEKAIRIPEKILESLVTC